MATNLVLDEAALRDFVGPATDQILLQHLFKAQIKKRLLQVAALHRQLEQEAPTLSSHTGCQAAYQILRQLAPPILTRLVSYPSFGQWCGVASDLLARKAHLNLPDGHVASHLGLLNNFALTGALASDLPVELSLWLDDHAVLPLPSLHCAITAPLELAGSGVHCRVLPRGWLTISGGNLTPQRFQVLAPLEANITSEEGFRLRVAPLLASRFELNDYDPLLIYSSGYKREERFEQVDARSQERWSHSIQAAWDLLEEVDPAYAAQVGQYVTVIAPLISPAANIHVSSSSRETYGMVQMSWIDRHALLAEALVHEYHHNKLNTLLELDPLINDHSGAELYYSPWRDDPRPLRGLLHGIFAFQAITHFWRAYLDAPQPLPEGSWAAQEYTRRRTQTLLAVDALLTQAELTPAGTIVVTEIQNQLRTLKDAPLPPRAQRRLEDDLAMHRLRWQIQHPQKEQAVPESLDDLWAEAGGGQRPRSITERYAADSPALEVICEHLGAPGGVLVNRTLDAQARRDTTLDFLALESVRNPEHFAQLAEQIYGSDEIGSPLQQLLAGHIAYIKGDYIVATSCYGNCIEAAPDNLDVWRDFAFALRHAGLMEEANTFLFHPSLVVTIANRYTPDLDVLRRLLVEPSLTLPIGFHNASPASRYLLLLRWLKEVLPA